MKKILVVLVLILAVSCTVEKTNYEKLLDVIERSEEAVQMAEDLDVSSEEISDEGLLSLTGNLISYRKQLFETGAMYMALEEDETKAETLKEKLFPVILRYDLCIERYQEELSIRLIRYNTTSV